MGLVRSNTAADITVRSPFNTLDGLMAAGAGVKAFLQVSPTNTIGYTRTQLVRAIAWRSIRSRHPLAQDGRLGYGTRANEIETAVCSWTKRPPEAGLCILDLIFFQMKRTVRLFFRR